VASATAALAQVGITSDNLRPARRNTKDTRQDLSDIQAYYGQELWRARLTRRSVALINERMDWGLAGKVGYRRLSPGQFAEELAPEQERSMARDLAQPTPPPVLLESKREGRAAATA